MIELRDVFCLYPLPGAGTVAALRGLSLSVAPGEIVVVHGPNGSGKTTLLRVLTGEAAVSAGMVQLAGVEPNAVVRRRALGIVDQHAARTLRPELTVLDNVGLQLQLTGMRRGEAHARAHEALGALGLESLASRTPIGLSAGEAQRVAVAAAIAHRPPVLLADEPTGELDQDATDAVLDLLREAARATGASLLLVTHDRQAARIADRVVRIRDGRLSESWTPGSAEQLVADDRGWIRLPEELRHGFAPTWDALRDGESIRLTGSATAASPPAPVEVPPLLQPYADDLVVATGIVTERGGRRVHDGLSLSPASPGLTAVRGPSGSGKSTLLSVLLGLCDPEEGSVLLAGVDLSTLDRQGRAALRHRWVATSLKDAALVENLDVVGNLALARAARGAPERDPWLDGLDLARLVGRPARHLSGGERQRLAIARALDSGRPLVVLDEPTSAQDEAHAEQVAGVLREAAHAGRTVLCATHDPVLAQAADQAIEL
ncbi:ABC transporter ATP-binding protein [Nocardioides sp. Kera G14]|uniref:ABC transporter ATP-binding protein n=1 Tax=Nocardioides sp. Kera G14 TaxID=2884264 RepID=UPI001D11A2A1|nr:ATP-binding cassette domain-containing protein [Nocardioides sp. Kera G14]UDY22195.1 ATP-binding cassette domain-containing protein [Nocardioides sp. Kera G14]